MKKLSASRRDIMVEAESRRVARVFLGYGSRPEGLQAGVDALEDHWREVRLSPISRWIRFYVVSWKAELFLRAGRHEEALAECNRSLSLPARPYGRAIAARRRAGVLRLLGRLDEAFEGAMSGLKICAKTGDVNSSAGLIREIVRLGQDGYLEELADRYDTLVLGALALPNEAKLIGLVPVLTPLQALKRLQEAMAHNGPGRQASDVIPLSE